MLIWCSRNFIIIIIIIIIIINNVENRKTWKPDFLMNTILKRSAYI